MKTTLCLFVLVAACAAVSGDEASNPPGAIATAQAELTWAKGVVTEFFDASFEKGSQQVHGLLHPEFAKTFYQFRLWQDFREYSSASITGAEIAPNQSEAVVSGVLKGKKGNAEFRVRVAKDSGGVWCIRFMNTRQRVEPVPKVPKGQAAVSPYPTKEPSR
jgi:hypothetical protein